MKLLCTVIRDLWGYGSREIITMIGQQLIRYTKASDEWGRSTYTGVVVVP